MTRLYIILLISFVTIYSSTYSSELIKESNLTNSDIKLINDKLSNIENALKISEKSHFVKYAALYVGLFALFGALYASYRQYKNTKGQAVANYRMKWIEDFRLLCSSLQISLDNIAFKSMDGHYKDVKKSVFAEDKDFITARTAYHTLRLMVDTTKNENIIYLDNVSDYIDKHIQFYNEEDDSLKFHELTKLKKTFFELSEKKLNDAWLKARALK